MVVSSEELAATALVSMLDCSPRSRKRSQGHTVPTTSAMNQWATGNSCARKIKNITASASVLRQGVPKRNPSSSPHVDRRHRDHRNDDNDSEGQAGSADEEG